MKKRTIFTYVIALAIPLFVGFLSSFLTRNGVSAFEMLEKPSWTPPAPVFPIVWTILYLLMGFGSARIYLSDHPNRQKALLLYGVQLVVNGLWSIFFFGFGWYFFSFLWIVLLLILVYNMMQEFYAIDKLSAWLQLPYFLWLLVALALNFSIWRMN